MISDSMGVLANNKLIWTPDVPIVYVDNPKCGSSTIKNSLKRAQAAEYSCAGVPFRLAENPHKADDCLKTRGLCADVCNDRFLISCVRNPFTRALSGYLDKVGSRPRLKYYPELRGHTVGSFEQHLLAIKDYPRRKLNYHLRPQHLNLDFPTIGYDAIFYLENIPALSRFLSDISPELKIETYAPHSRSALSKLHEHYTDRAIELVRTIYAKDFQLFGYNTRLEDIECVPGDYIVDRHIRTFERNGPDAPLDRPARIARCEAFATTIRYHKLVDMLHL